MSERLRPQTLAIHADHGIEPDPDVARAGRTVRLKGDVVRVRILRNDIRKRIRDQIELPSRERAVGADRAGMAAGLQCIVFARF